jgi:phosphatidylserine/phosphatidylglycerophosphate/cardiolipin synthase-like enzyme
MKWDVAQADRLSEENENAAVPPHIPWPEACGRVAAWEMLERQWAAAGFAPLDGALQQAAWRTLSYVYDGVESFHTDAQARAQVHRELDNLGALEADKAATAGLSHAVPAALTRLLQSLARALLGDEDTDAPPQSPPDLLRHIESATQEAVPRQRGRIRTQPPRRPQPLGTDVFLGPLLHGGDEIWGAAAVLVARAQHSIYLQVWAYYRRSEGAKHIMGALAQVLLRQARRRSRGEAISPIKVALLAGYLDEDVGLAHHTGGLSSAGHTTDDTHRAYLYRIFPFPVDPSLMQVHVINTKGDGRGHDRSKLVVVDDTYALVTSANVQGSHHRVSSDGVPLHDLGCVLHGPVVQHELAPAIADRARRGVLLASNAATPGARQADLLAAVVSSAAAHTPLPLPRDEDATWCAKRDALVQALTMLSTVSGTPTATRIGCVALVQLPRNLLFARNQRTPYQRGLLAAVAGAQRRIDINHCNITAPPFVAALKAALARGVEIRLLAAEGLTDGIQRAAQAPRRHIFDVLLTYKRRTKAPGHIYLRWQRHAHFGHVYRNSHAKALFVDGAVAVIGAVDLDAVAWRQSGMLALAVGGAGDVHRLHRAIFLGFWDAARRRLEVAQAPDAAGAAEGEMTWEATEGPSRQPSNSTPSAGLAALAVARAPGRFVDAFFQRALVSTDVAVKGDYLRAFNQHFAPRITSEEAALERLAVKHIRLSLPEGATFAFNIRRNVMQQATTDYATAYRLAETIVDGEEGLRAYLLMPLPAATMPAAGRRAIIAYEGTTLRKDAVREQQHHPTGRRSATDRQGLGFKAFAASRARLLALSDRAQLAGHPLTLIGFSLGGAQAARHWHALPTEQQHRVRLLTFAMPGLDRATAEAMAGPAADANVRHFRVRLDPFSKVGQARVPGKVFRCAGRRPYPSLANHTYAYLSEREIDGLPLDLHFDTGHDDDPLSPRLDRFRRFWGLLRPAR